MKEQPYNSEHRGFKSKLGAVLAASGCAVGIGNIWGFPIKTAENHGAAFVVVYLFLSFFLAYPVLIAELAIGKHYQSNPVSAMEQISKIPILQFLGKLIGITSVTTVSVIYSFYSIIGGWFIGYCLFPLISYINPEWAIVLIDFSIPSTISLTLTFMALTTCIVTQEVENGIELWSKRLMPVLFILIILLIIFALFLPGSIEGLKIYLVPDFQHITNPQLLISALGQSFFSMSLGAGTMMVYGSYLKNNNVSSTAIQIVIIDTSAAFLAGLLIIPCMFAAMHSGIQIFSETGSLFNSDKLVFQVLPALFSNLGTPLEQIITTAFYLLLTITALTSSISMLETPVACLLERKQDIKRSPAALIVTLTSAVLSIIIIFNMDSIFSKIVSITTEHMLPLLSLLSTLYCTWLWRQHTLMKAFQIDLSTNRKQLLLWKIWLWHTKIICPILILILIYNSL